MRQTKTLFWIGFLACLWLNPSFASSDWLIKDHPQTYEVRKGDTLWEVAGHFLKEPWRWPEVWKGSPGRSNPDLLFPGDVISLSMNEGAPHLSVLAFHDANVAQSVTKDGVVKLSPRVRNLPSARAIPTIPLSVIGPFLSQSKIVNSTVVAEAFRVGELEESRILASDGTRFYVKDLCRQPGEGLGVYREGAVLKHPLTHEILGHELKFLGNAEVLQAGPLTELILRKGIEEVRSGNVLLSLEEDLVEPYFFPKSPDGDPQGFILSVLGGVNQIGDHQVVSISGGQDLCRAEGDVLSVIQTKKAKQSRLVRQESFEREFNNKEIGEYRYQPIEVGRVIVFKVFEKTSFALVMNSIRPIHLHDEVVRP